MGAYVVIMVVLVGLLALYAYWTWHSRVGRLLRMDEQVRADIARRRQAEGGPVDLAPWPAGNPNSGPGRSQPSGSAGSGGGYDYDDSGGPRL